MLTAAPGILGIFVLLMLASARVDRAPPYQAEIKEWVHDRSGYTIAFAQYRPRFAWYGPELVFDRLELRSKDGGRVWPRAAVGRAREDLSQLVQSRQI